MRKIKSIQVRYLVLLIILLQASLIYPTSGNAESAIEGRIFYHYDQASHRLEYAIDYLGHVNYYLYDRNGNLKRRLASASFPIFASSSLEGWEPYKLGDGNGGTLWSSEAQGTENDIQMVRH